MRYEIVFSGSGGQGMILCGIVTAEAAALHDRKHAVQTQSYGPEARGGMTESYVIVSDSEPVDYPEITEADVLVALSQPGLDRQLPHLRKGATVIVDTKGVDASKVADAKVFCIPCTDISNEIMGRPISANIVALGAFAANSSWISKQSLKNVVEKRVPKGTTGKNLEAFEAGFSAMEKLLAERGR